MKYLNIFFSGKGGAATAPDWNDVAKEDEVADGVSKHVTSSYMVKLAKVPVLWPARCTLKKRLLSSSAFFSYFVS